MKIRKGLFDRVGVPFVCETLNDKGEFVPDPGRTKQADKESCDINNILSRFEKTGQLPDLIKSDSRYGDFSDVVSYEKAFEAVSIAEEQFMALDATVRARFDHDPVKMLEFVSDPKNKEKLVEMGLALPKAAAPTVVDNGQKGSANADPAAVKNPPSA